MVEEVGEVEGQEGARAEHGRPSRSDAGRNDSPGRFARLPLECQMNIDQVTNMSPSLWEPLAADYPRGELIEPHSHDLAQIVFAKSGVMRVHAAAGAWVVPPERALWMPAGVTHWIHCRTAVAMRTIYLDQAAAPRSAAQPAVLAASAAPARDHPAPGRGRLRRSPAPCSLC